MFLRDIVRDISFSTWANPLVSFISVSLCKWNHCCFSSPLLLLCTIAQELGSNLMKVPWKCPSEPTWQHCRNEWEVILWSNLQRELTAVKLYWPCYCTSRGLQILHTINLEIQLLNSQTAVSQNPLVHLASSDLSLDTVRRWHVQISQVKCFITNTSALQVSLHSLLLYSHVPSPIAVTNSYDVYNRLVVVWMVSMNRGRYCILTHLVDWTQPNPVTVIQYVDC